MSQPIYEQTIAGEIIMNQDELSFLYLLTGKNSPYEAAEVFALACLNHHKEPQQVLRELQIMGQPVMFIEEGQEPPEPVYQKVSYRLIKETR